MRLLVTALAAALIAVPAAAALPPATLTVAPGGTALTLANGFVTLTFDLLRGTLLDVRARLEGDGAFAQAPNVASPMRGSATPGGVQVGALAVVVTGTGQPLSYQETATSAFTRGAPAAYVVTANSPSAVAVTVVGLVDGAYTTSPAPRITANVSLSLSAGSRWFTVGVTASAVRAFNTSLVRVSTAWAPASSVALYDTGVRQGLAMEQPYLASTTPWHRWYGVGRAGAVEIVPTAAAPGASSMPTVLFAGTWNGRSSGWDVVLAGSVNPFGWLDGLEGGQPITVAAGTVWPTVTLDIAPSNYDTPIGRLPVAVLPPAAAAAINVDDVRSVLTPTFASTLGAMHSYDFAPEGRIAPCINVGGSVCYSPLYNFYDPDSFLSNAALLWSFDVDAIAEGVKIVETNALFICTPSTPAQCDVGQMIHHFVPSCQAGDKTCYCTASPVNPLAIDCVTFAAISTASQTGPNIFWTLAALRHAAFTGNTTWLARYLPVIRASMQFLMNKYEPTIGLFNVPGPLWVDTFIRANFTSDTNTAMIMLCDRMADMEASMGNTTGAAYYASIVSALRVAIPKYLMAPSGDHLCTNANPGATPGSIVPCARDFVDYDSNLLAVATGAVTGATAAAVLARVDSGVCTHARGTYVSEVYYDAANCNVGNTGDSAVTMGRIAWADGLARKAVGDAASAAAFFELVLGPLQAELLESTWMYERYTCSASPTHNAYYIEMGEVVAMLVSEVKWGLDIGFNTITISPIVTVDSFAAALSTMTVAYDNGASGGTPSVTASFPPPGTRTIVATRMPAGTYTVTITGAPVQPFSVTVGGDGVLRFATPTGAGITAVATLQ